MWVQQADLDQKRETLPIPSRICSNEEFLPPPQSAKQKEYEARVLAISDKAAKKQGLSRRAFLRTGSGMAAALTALNQTFGNVYDVDAAEIQDQQAFAEKWPKNQFIFDVQTHHVNVSRVQADKSADAFLRQFRPGAKGLTMEVLNRAHFVKEMFGDSDTVMACISGLPTRDWKTNMLPPDQMAATRDYVNGLAKSQRMLSHGLLRPNLGKPELEEMERQVKKLRIEAWKCYTGAEIGSQPWFLDEEKVAYPFWERTLKLGIRNVCVHKGLPLGSLNERACTPHDVEKAAKDFPNLNFIIYHSGFRGPGNQGRGSGKPVIDPNVKDPQEIPWISDIFRILKRNPKMRNVYFELGNTFQQLSMSDPVKCLHMLGQMLQTGGADHILWGTDCIWSGSPQSQIDRLRRMTMTDELMNKFKYPQLTAAIKDQILGLNAAQVFNINVKAQRAAIKVDKLTSFRDERRNNPDPSNTQYGWEWTDYRRTMTVPVGE
ncbi:MAG TPA: amidohydrolase family protein [Gemmataceae bacterium]|nr:amidohydrolase family protein [Gemmataceae bacterium]